MVRSRVLWLNTQPVSHGDCSSKHCHGSFSLVYVRVWYYVVWPEQVNENWPSRKVRIPLYPASCLFVRVHTHIHTHQQSHAYTHALEGAPPQTDHMHITDWPLLFTARKHAELEMKWTRFKTSGVVNKCVSTRALANSHTCTGTRNTINYQQPDKDSSLSNNSLSR